MKRIGIIDNYISNFHANTYYKLFKQIAEEEGREEYIITKIYACLDKSPTTGEPTAEWCERVGAVAMATPEEVCEDVDAIMVLAPNHPALHEDFCRAAFSSGKPVYVDKTFAPDFETAKRIVDMAGANNVRFWSSSATRFEPALLSYRLGETDEVQSVNVISGNNFDMYAIHLVELMNTFMKNGAKTVVCHNNTATLVFEVEFGDGRKAFINQHCGAAGDFICYPEINGTCKKIVCGSDFWKGFCREVMNFFDGGEIAVSNESTLECIAVLDAMKKAKNEPKTVFEVGV